MKTGPTLVTLCILVSIVVAAQAREKRWGMAEALTEIAKPALVSAPQDQEVCFSPDEPCDIKLVKFVDSAEKSIEVAIYDINLEELVHHLLVKSKKIPVRIVV